ncbi:MAG: bifunctional pyr operon transcriptional regulator/uracil phosphoribosyltransferase PyrR [Bacteroidetes bacterium]|nr:bifunctional pyr operon transcriptional regulator/uracil phosphoribosyltransferase PyrR [Bacteroidota bacterium]
MKVLLNAQEFEITLQRIAYELVEHHDNFEETAIIGIQPRGVLLSDRLVGIIRAITGNDALRYGKLDITFHRDDLHTRAGMQVPSVNDIPFSIEGRKLVLIDDVLHTGRTIRAAMDAVLAYGRPSKIELLSLVDRKFSRELPVQADYTGRSIDTIATQRVLVEWEPEPRVLLIDG